MIFQLFGNPCKVCLVLIYDLCPILFIIIITIMTGPIFTKEIINPVRYLGPEALGNSPRTTSNMKKMYKVSQRNV